MVELTHSDGSAKLDVCRHHLEQPVKYFEEKSSLTEDETDLLDLIVHTVGHPITDDSFGTPVDEYMETIVGSDETIRNLSNRILELSDEVAKENETYNQRYKKNIDAVFSIFADAKL